MVMLILLQHSVDFQNLVAATVTQSISACAGGLPSCRDLSRLLAFARSLAWTCEEWLLKWTLRMVWGSRPVAVRLSIGQRQGNAPGTSKEQPALDSQGLSQRLKVANQGCCVVVLKTSQRL